jgi:hypothetical protein
MPRALIQQLKITKNEVRLEAVIIVAQQQMENLTVLHMYKQEMKQLKKLKKRPRVEDLAE